MMPRVLRLPEPAPDGCRRAGTRHRQQRARAGRAAQSAARRRACRPARGCPAGRNGRAGTSSAACAMPQPSSCTRQLDVLRVEAQHDVDPPRARMFQRVGQRLEPDAQQMVLVRRVEPPRHAFHDARGPRRRPTAPVSSTRSVSAPARSRLSSACDRRSITDRRASSWLYRSICRATSSDCCACSGDAAQAAADRFELQRDAGQPLLERVVQLARRPGSARSAPPDTAAGAAAPPCAPRPPAAHAPSARIATITAVCRSVHHGRRRR